MYTDKQLEFSSEQAVTATAASTNNIDLGAARDVGVSEGLHVFVNVDEAAVSAGASTLVVALEVDSDPAFGSAKVVATTAAIPKATLVAGHSFYLPVPVGADERYMRLNYTVGTANLTAGKFTASIVKDIQSSKAYPDAL